jgi:hypothetical protein
MIEGADQSVQHFGRGLEQSHGLRLGNLFDILTQMVRRLLQTLLHLLRVVRRVGLVPCLISRPFLSGLHGKPPF